MKNHRRLWIGLGGETVLFITCTVIMLVMYPRTESVFSLVLFILPVAYAATFWGITGGMTIAVAATVATTFVVFFTRPESTLRTLGLAAFVFCGLGTLTGYLFQVRRKLNDTVRTLEESEERYRSLFYRMPVGLYRIHPDGYVVDANEAFAKILRYADSGALLNKNAKDFYINPKHHEIFISIIEEDGNIDDFEVRLIREDGETVDAMISGHRALDPTTNTFFYEGSIKDISVKKNLEEQRTIAKNQQQRADRMSAVAELAAGVAHDFNNILFGIRAHAQVIGLDTITQDRRVSSVNKILSAVDRASVVSEGLSSAIGNTMPSVHKFDLQGIVSNSYERVAASLPEAVRISLSTAVDPIPVTLDPDTIDECIRELITNAERAVNGSGHISVSCAIEPLQRSILYSAPDDYSDARYACISVTDDGIGIDEKNVDRIFEPYFTTQEFGNSAGIGLAEVYGSVHQQGGLIGVQSSPGSGTTVKLYFPITEFQENS
jgi:PAS domain S-box-containing protein